jgi:hypothetical protein
MDCIFILLKNTFPDSKVDRKSSSFRIKTEAIVNSVLVPHSVKAVLKALEENYTVYCGASADGTHHRSTKYFP